MPTCVKLAAPVLATRKAFLGANIRCAKVGYGARANVYHKSTTAYDRDCTPVDRPHGDSLHEGIENVISLTSLLSAGERQAERARRRARQTCGYMYRTKCLSCVQNMCGTRGWYVAFSCNNKV